MSRISFMYAKKLSKSSLLLSGVAFRYLSAIKHKTFSTDGCETSFSGCLYPDSTGNTDASWCPPFLDPSDSTVEAAVLKACVLHPAGFMVPTSILKFKAVELEQF